MQTEVRDPEQKLILSRIYTADGELTVSRRVVEIWKLILFASRNRSYIIHIANTWRAYNLLIHEYNIMV